MLDFALKNHFTSDQEYNSLCRPMVNKTSMFDIIMALRFRFKIFKDQEQIGFDKIVVSITT